MRGYVHWSLLDNFEWSEGFTPRFGLFRVGRNTQRRSATSTAHFYRDVIAAQPAGDTTRADRPMIESFAVGWPSEGYGGMEQIRVLIADDHPVFRDGLRLVVASEEHIDVVAVAAEGTEAVTAARDLQPDVIVMDLNMPGVNGVEATRRIVQESPHIGVLVLTMFEDDESVFAAMRAGARGYLLKGAVKDEIVRAIEAVGGGTAVFGQSIAQRLIEFFAIQRPGGAMTAFPELTDREREILDLIAKGVNNSTIARQLFLSPKTIRNNVSNIFSKLQVADRAEAIVRARRAGLGQD